MCIAIVQPAGCRIDERHLVNSFTGNPDGAGFAYVHEGEVVIAKGYFKLSSFINAYNTIHDAYGKDGAVLAHCRIATAGAVDADNCHPFKIKGGAMIHNGHLWSTPDGEKKSDTREFSEIFYNILDIESVKAAVDKDDFTDIIGHDKMAFLYNDGQWAVAGDWTTCPVSGVMYSNRGYQSGMGHDPRQYMGYNDAWDYDAPWKWTD